MQSPGNAQNYNRYSYCLNNPLMYTDPSGWTYQYVSEEDKNAWYQGAEFYNTINNLNNRYGGGGGGASGVGGPGQGGNGTGLNGVYYDWVSGTYRSVFTEQEVSGPVFRPTDFLAHYSGKAAENFVAAYQNLLRGSYTITLTDAGPGVKLDGWRGTPLAMPYILPAQPSLMLPSEGSDDNGHWGTGAYISGTFAPIIGPTVEIGFIIDSYSQTYAYLSLGIAVGAEASGGGGVIVVPYKSFNGQNWFGDGFGGSINVPGGGFEYSQSMYDTQYRAFKGNLGIGLGGSVNASYTFTIPVIPDIWTRPWRHF